MIRHTADAVAFPIAMTGDRGEIGMEIRADVRSEERHAILRAEDEMRQGQAEGLWHDEMGVCRGADGAGLWPLEIGWAGDLGRWPRLV
jgi:hypothetical protein